MVISAINMTSATNKNILRLQEEMDLVDYYGRTRLGMWLTFLKV